MPCKINHSQVGIRPRIVDFVGRMRGADHIIPALDDITFDTVQAMQIGFDLVLVLQPSIMGKIVVFDAGKRFRVPRTSTLYSAT